jgi:hypothetical protein
MALLDHPVRPIRFSLLPAPPATALMHAIIPLLAPGTDTLWLDPPRCCAMQEAYMLEERGLSPVNSQSPIALFRQQVD